VVGLLGGVVVCLLYCGLEGRVGLLFGWVVRFAGSSAVR